MYYPEQLGITTGRRAFLKILASLTAATGAGLVGCARHVDIPPGLAFLDETTFGIIKAFAERIIPPGGAFPEGAGDIDVISYFDSVVSAQPPEVQKDMRSGILLMEYRAVLYRLSLKRFTEMSPEMQDQYLKSWEESSIGLFRGIFWGFKKICCLGFFSHEKIWPYIGYDGRWI